MRISDWSSDVCSSDLKQVPDRHITPGTVVEPGGIKGDQRQYDHHGKRDRKRFLQRRGQRPLEAEIKGQKEGKRHCPCVEGYDSGEPYEALQCCFTGHCRCHLEHASLLGSPAPMRSEEHTSELQSLKRKS